MSILLELFPYAIIIGFLLGVISPLYGINVVLRRILMVSLSLPQVSMLGVTIGLILGISPYLPSSILTIIAGIVLSLPLERYRISKEGVAVILFLASNAFIYLLLNLSNVSFEEVKGSLAGNFLISSQSDCIIYALLALVSLIVFIKIFKINILSATDYDFVKVINKKIHLFEGIFFILLSLFISISTKITGSLLVFSSLIMPVYFAMMFSNRFKRIILISIIYNLICIYTGLYVSYILDFSSSYTIVALQVCLFLIVRVLRIKTK